MAAAAALYLAGAYFYFEWFSLVSLIPALAGIGLLSGGGNFLRWAWPGLAFLVFMLPLPYRVETALAHPLRSLATIVSTYALQTLGLPAVAEAIGVQATTLRHVSKELSAALDEFAHPRTGIMPRVNDALRWMKSDLQNAGDHIRAVGRLPG